MGVVQVPGTEVLWVVGGSDQARTYGGGEADELPARGALDARLQQLVRSGRVELVVVDTGYEQARSVVAALAGDWEAARNVQLNLPETGVCSSNLAYGDNDDEASGGCCGPAAPVAVDALAGRGLATGISGGLLTVIDSKPTTQSNCCS